MHHARPSPRAACSPSCSPAAPDPAIAGQVRADGHTPISPVSGQPNALHLVSSP